MSYREANLIPRASQRIEGLPLVGSPRSVHNLREGKSPYRNATEVATIFGDLAFISQDGINLPPSQSSYFMAVRAAQAFKEIMPDRSVIVDVGTGSGVLAIAIAKELEALPPEKQLIIAATDISQPTLDLARENADINGFGDIRFHQMDGMEGIKRQYGPVDLIISNPPFYDSDNISYSMRRYNFTPYHAIDGGHDGLDFYRKFFEQAAYTLSDEGAMVVQVPQKSGLNRIIAEATRFMPGRHILALTSTNDRVTTLVIGAPNIINTFIRKFPDNVRQLC